MMTVRRSEERRHVQSKSQNTWMTFDSENEIDPLRGGFRGLETLNEEHVAAKMGLHPRSQSSVDLLTYVREGSLIHQDEAGNFARVEAGEFQYRNLSASMRYGAVNGSITNTAHVFQSSLTPEGLAPDVDQAQKRFYSAERTGTLRLVASQGGERASLALGPDVRVYSAILHPGSHLVHEFGAGRTAWLHVVTGRILLQDRSLRTGDAAGLIGEASASFTAQEPSEILLFDLA